MMMWILPISAVLIGLALGLAFSQPTQRGRRALLAAGPTLWLLGVTLVLPRLVQLLHPQFGGGPQKWIVAAINMVLPEPWRVVLHPYDAAVIEHVGVCLAVLVLLPVVCLVFRIWPPKPSRPLPLALPTSLVLGLVTLLLPFVLHRALHGQVFVPGLEFLAPAPVLALLVGLRLHAAWPAIHSAQSTRAFIEEKTELPDIRQAWIRADVLQADSEPQLRLPSADAPSTVPAAASLAVQRAWAASGAQGSPPGALSELLERGETRTLLVGDLPPHTEDALLDAFFVHHAGVGGARILALVDDPAATCARVQAALERAHTWEPGALTVGAAALTEALARQQAPVIAFLALRELDASLVHLAERDGAQWAKSLDWLVLHHPHEGAPLAVTHTAFALKRWALATASSPSPSVLATGPDTPAMLAFLDAVVPGVNVTRCTPRLPEPGPVVIWPAHTQRSSSADPWTARAAHAAAELGVTVQLYDRRLDTLAHQHADVKRVNAVDVSGPASVASLPAHALTRAWRAAHHRLPDTDVPTHSALWHVQPSPLGHFLATPGRLAALHARRELPVPKPVVGTRNRFLRLAHLRAALEDGQTDELSLRRAFGDDVVDFAMNEVEPTGRWLARVRAGSLERAPVLRGPRGVDAPEPGREALTAQRVRIVDDRSGDVLAEVDALLASTRYHPKRVFEVGGRRYRVPLHAMDVKRGQLRVVPADPRDSVTLPLLRVSLEPLQTQVDKVTRTQ
ncbi:MAG: hypothetical protein AB8H79_02060, partial [Myxococcota bacterium]